MKSSRMKWSVLAAFLLAGGVAMAQDQSSSGSQSSSSESGSSATPTPAPAEKPKPTIAERKENQQDRMANGVKSGQLTANLEKKEAAINRETAAHRAANGGKLTAAEKRRITRQQNQMSKQIYADKHNAATAHYGNNEVGQRRENQQDRIAQGIKSGQLTAGETAKLEKQQQGINKQVAADRKANGGKLDAGQKQQINREQNAASRNIYRKKHNARTQPGAGKP